MLQNIKSRWRYVCWYLGLKLGTLHGAGLENEGHVNGVLGGHSGALRPRGPFKGCVRFKSYACRRGAGKCREEKQCFLENCSGNIKTYEHFLKVARAENDAQ